VREIPLRVELVVIDEGSRDGTHRSSAGSQTKERSIGSSPTRRIRGRAVLPGTALTRPPASSPTSALPPPPTRPSNSSSPAGSAPASGPAKAATTLYRNRVYGTVAIIVRL
jgi:hypothetical protein